jgi:hypothetical protein
MCGGRSGGRCELAGPAGPAGQWALRTLRAEGLGLLSAFVRFASWRAGAGAGLVALGAVFDGVGLLLLVPILDLATGSGAAHGLAIPLTWPLFERLRLQSPDLRLLALLAGFCALMAVRGLVLYSRDRAIDRLQFEFVRRIRMGLVQAIADAGWRRTARIHHARVVQADRSPRGPRSTRRRYDGSPKRSGASNASASSGSFRLVSEISWPLTLTPARTTLSGSPLTRGCQAARPRPSCRRR